MSELLNDQTVEMLVNQSVGSSDESAASINLESLVIADEGKTIRGEDLYTLVQEAKAKGVTIASLLHKLPNASSRVLVSPGRGVVEQAERTGVKKKA